MKMSREKIYSTEIWLKRLNCIWLAGCYCSEGSGSGRVEENLVARKPVLQEMQFLGWAFCPLSGHSPQCTLVLLGTCGRRAHMPVSWKARLTSKLNPPEHILVMQHKGHHHPEMQGCVLCLYITDNEAALEGEKSMQTPKRLTRHLPRARKENSSPHTYLTHKYRVPRKAKNIKKANQGYFPLPYLMWPGDPSQIFVSNKTVAVSRSTTDQPALPSASPQKGDFHKQKFYIALFNPVQDSTPFDMKEDHNW